MSDDFKYYPLGPHTEEQVAYYDLICVGYISLLTKELHIARQELVDIRAKQYWRKNLW